MKASVLAGYVAMVAVWGFTWGAIKIGVAQVPPFVFAFERAVVVALLLAAIGLVLRQPFPRGVRLLATVSIVGIINTGTSWIAIYWGEQYVPSGLVAVFGATGVVWTAFFAHFLVRGDRLSWLKVLAIALGVVGTAVLVGSPPPGSAPEALLAMVLLALMPVSWAVAAILAARALAETAPIPAVAVGVGAGAIVLLPFALAQRDMPAHWTLDAVLVFAYLVIFGSGVALVLNLWLYRMLRPTTVMLAQVLIPVEAIAVGALVLGEQLDARMLLGAALVIAAVAANALSGGRARAADLSVVEVRRPG